MEILHEFGVEFVVVGGVAAQAHGWTGATLDLDIAAASDDANTARLNAALAKVDAGPPQYGQFGTSFLTIYGRLEIIRRADGIGAYTDWMANARTIEIEGLSILVAAPADILRSKEAAGRDKDLQAIAQMEKDFRDAGAL